DGIRDYKVTGVQTCALPIWIGGQEPEWREREGETEQVIRVEERAGVRVEDVGVEEPARPGGERVLVPGERPGVQEAVVPGYALRSEERRVGKECRCRRWGAP